jgi:hypothetical protein
LASLTQQREQTCPRLAEQIHDERRALGRVLDVLQASDDAVEQVDGRAEVARRIFDRNAERLEGFRGWAACRLRGLVDVACELRERGREFLGR